MSFANLAHFVTGYLHGNFFFLESSGVISAKPQLRNIRAEVTKFIPTAVKLRRNPGPVNKAKPKIKWATTTEDEEPEKATETKTQPTKDDVYAKFMDEMTGFL